ncbi:MAG TPA: hypothetical protein VHZ51_23675, partial [Ktedonobacteraceae bacterium]|nr:hypothetical protein [Ktedonobacteraceae bacterium]
MSSKQYLETSTPIPVPLPAPYLQPPPGRRYVRTFFFSRHIDAPFASVHPIARTLLVLCLSAAQLQTIATNKPDLLGAIVLWIVSLGLFFMSGLNEKIARWYFILTLPTLCSLFLTWFLFNPVPGTITYIHQQVYPGFLIVGITGWEIAWLAIVGGYFAWTRKVLMGMIIATLAT